jgi:hypothetical protein
MKVSNIQILFKLQDFWIGAFWKTRDIEAGTGAKWRYFDIWICIIPCFPLHIRLFKPINQLAKNIL